MRIYSGAATLIATAILLTPVWGAAEIPSAPRTPSYDAFGFAFASGGSVYAVARQGRSHQQDAGRLATFRFSGAGAAATFDPVASPFPGIAGLDNRNIAGGIDGDGCLITFWATRAAGSSWLRMLSMRSAPPGSHAACRPSLSDVPAGADVVFSPYGPMVTLPSGKRLQTVYGNSTTTPPHVRVVSSIDGATWVEEAEVDRGWDIRPTEAAMVRLDGEIDQTTRLLMVVRSYRTTPQGNAHSLRQYLSVNGGQNWMRFGEIPVTSSPQALVPWIAVLPGDRVAMVWADRGDLTLKASIAEWKDVITNPAAWPAPTVLYTSRLALLEPAQRSVGDFGYPSIAMRGPNPIVVFYDATLDPLASSLGEADTALYEVPLHE